MFVINDTDIRGFMELQPVVQTDTRGSFVKTFHRRFFAENNLAIDFPEQYYSASKRRVLRGFHFQLPPYDHAKLVFCVVGEIIDVALDLRTDSPTFGKTAKIIVSAERANIAYLTTGLAHAFYVLSELAIVAYNVTTAYAPAHDAGIRWDTVGVQWPDASPIISERDATFPSLAEFCSPFKMSRTGN